MPPPNHMMPTMALYIASWKEGRFSRALLKVPRLVPMSEEFTSPNLPSSYSPRTKALTARMAVRFSCTTALSRSTAFWRIE